MKKKLQAWGEGKTKRGEKLHFRIEGDEANPSTLHTFEDDATIELMTTNGKDIRLFRYAIHVNRSLRAIIDRKFKPIEVKKGDQFEIVMDEDVTVPSVHIYFEEHSSRLVREATPESFIQPKIADQGQSVRRG